MSKDSAQVQNQTGLLGRFSLKRRHISRVTLIGFILVGAVILCGCGVLPVMGGFVPVSRATGTISPSVSDPESARDVAFLFVQENYDDVVPPSMSQWLPEDEVSGNEVNRTTFQYVSDDWKAKVIYPVTTSNETFFAVKLEGGPYGLVWKGLVDLTGKVITSDVSLDDPSITQAVQSPTFTPTPTSTPTPFPPTITPTAIPKTATPRGYCDWLLFVKDVTIPDGIILQAGDTFVKTWRLKNRGTCTWTPNYSLVFSSGSQLGQTSEVKLSSYVKPGETVDVSVALKVPSSPGNYRGYWMLRNDSGVLFGYGEFANKAFFVDIKSASKDFGTVSGEICFPSGDIPAMTLYLQNMSRQKLFRFPIEKGQASYQFHVEPGEYMAYAWTLNDKYAGGYTLEDHRLKGFDVDSGSKVDGIDICDWEGDSGSIPLPKDENYGAISGKLSFPSENIPPLRVVVYEVYNNSYHWIDTVENQLSYEITGLMPGYYTVVAYTLNGDFAGGYTEYAKCGLGPDCLEDHTLVITYVTPGMTSGDVNPADWYAPANTFPEDPTR